MLDDELDIRMGTLAECVTHNNYSTNTCHAEQRHNDRMSCSFSNEITVEITGELILCKAVFFFFRLLRVFLYYYETTPITNYCGNHIFADRYCCFGW